MQGHEITNTLIAYSNACAKEAPYSNQPIKTNKDIIIMEGTNILATLSAPLAIGALVAEASDINFIICEKVVSSPT